MNATDRPRLRAIEPVQVEVEGRTMIALKDPDGYSDETALVEPGLLGLLVVFDGVSTIAEIEPHYGVLEILHEGMDGPRAWVPLEQEYGPEDEAEWWGPSVPPST